MSKNPLKNMFKLIKISPKPAPEALKDLIKIHLIPSKSLRV
jgi:hypothetical protein